MTKQEKIIVSAFTGILMCSIADYHKYAESLMHRPVLAHELADDGVQDMIKQRSKPDFIRMCKSEVIIPKYGMDVINALKCKGLSKECDKCTYGLRYGEDSECNDACDYERYEVDAAELLERLYDALYDTLQQNNELLRKLADAQKEVNELEWQLKHPIEKAE